jgi:HNH endonuclease
METWKLVGPPYRASYEVSDHGRIRGSMRIRRHDTQCSARQGFLGTREDFREGYCKVSLALADGSGRKLVSVHRLVALAFVPGDHSLDVNHRDGNKANNHADNLEWITHAQNIRHGMTNHPTWVARLQAHGKGRRRPVIGTDANGVETRYESLAATGHGGNVCRAIDIGATSYGCTWRYA